MSDRLKEKLGEELYGKILEKGIKASEIDLVNSDWVSYNRFKEVNDKYKTEQEKVKSYEQKHVDTEKLLSENKDLKTKYDDLSTKHKSELEAKDIEILNTTKKYKATEALTKAGAKDIDYMLYKMDMSKLSLDNDNLIGITDMINGLKKDYKDHFVEKKRKSNANSGGSNNEDETNNDISEEDLMKHFNLK